MASVTVTLPDSVYLDNTGNNRIQWLGDAHNGSEPNLGSDLAALSADIYLDWFVLHYTGALAGRVVIRLTDTLGGPGGPAGPEFSTQMEDSGVITLTNSDGDTLVITGISDATEPYGWTPANSSDVIAFANAIRALADNSLTVTFNDNAAAAPDTPPAPTLTPLSDTEIEVDFTDPDGNGATITRRDVRYRESGTSTYTVRDSVNIPYTMAGLTVNTEYEVSVRVHNSEGDSGWGPNASASTKKTPLALTDWSTVGHEAAIILAVLPVTIGSGGDITVDPVTPTDGELVVASDLTIDGVERADSGRTIRLRRTGTGSLSTYFDNEGTPQFPDAKLFLVLRDDTNSLRTLAFVIGATGGGFNNWIQEDDTATNRGYIEGLETGDEFLIAIAEPQTAAAPMWADDRSDAMAWTVGVAIDNFTVPEVDEGSPAPTYADVPGTLPGGLNFSNEARLLHGTPTTEGTGTIVIRATNSEGSDDYFIAYTIGPAPPEPEPEPEPGAPTFGDVTIPDQVAFQDGPFSLRLPAATGDARPLEYTLTPAIPGLSYDAGIRTLSGIPAAQGATTLTYEVTDQNGNGVDVEFDLVVAAPLTTANIQWQVRVDWDNTGDFSIAGADVTNRILSEIYAERGRDFNATFERRPIPGQLSVSLNNSSGDYTRFNASSPLAGHLRGGAAVQLRYGHGGNWRERWTGHLLDIRPGLAVGDVPAVELTAIGALAQINQEPVELPTQEQAHSGEIVSEVLNEANWPAAKRQIDRGQTRLNLYTAGSSGPRLPLDMLTEMEQTEGGAIYEPTNGDIAFRDRYFRPANSTPIITISDLSTAGHVAASTESSEDPTDTVFTEFVARVDGLMDDTIQAIVYEAMLEQNPISIEPGATREIRAIFSARSDKERDLAFAGVSAWEAPEIVANAAVDGSGADLSADLTVTLTPFVTSALVSIENTASVPARLTSFTIAGTRLIAGDASEEVARSATLEALTGRRRYPPTPTFNDPDEAESWTHWHRDIFDEARPVLNLQVPGSRDNDNLRGVLAADLLDRVAIDMTATNGLDIDEDFILERMADVIDLSQHLYTGLTLIAASAYEDWCVLGASTAGDNHKVGW